MTVKINAIENRKSKNTGNDYLAIILSNGLTMCAPEWVKDNVDKIKLPFEVDFVLRDWGTYTVQRPF